MPESCGFGWSELFEFVTAAAAVFAVALGYKGLRAWRDEKINGRMIEVAEEISVLVYKSKDVFSDVRRAFSFGTEGTTRPRGASENESESSSLDQLYVPIERLNRHEDYFERVISGRLTAKILLGQSAFEMLNRILDFRNRIVMATRYGFTMARRGNRSLTESQIQKELEYDRIKYETDEEEDTLTKEIERNILYCEKEIVPIIKKHLKR